MIDPPPHLEKILWEYDTAKLDKDHPIVLERVLLLGEPEDIRYVGLERLKQHLLLGQTKLEERDLSFWETILDIPHHSLSPVSLYESINTPQVRRNFGR